MASGAHEVYRKLPSVAEVLELDGIVRLSGMYSRQQVTEGVRAVLAGLRGRVRAGELDAAGLAECVAGVAGLIEQELAGRVRPRLRRVVNATGVILQTNLGRAPLSDVAIERITEVARGYCNLEFDLEAGGRSRRDVLVEGLILDVLGLGGHSGEPEGELGDHSPVVMNGVPGAAAGSGAAVVNNCAAATFLALNTLAEGGEVVVSRGELVEIGGGFRVPEIMAKSRAVLREVGTTNKTRVGDYAAAIGPMTRLILRVHRSNFEIRGFTEQPSLEELVELGRMSGVPVFEDQGTGCLVDLREVGLAGEASWVRSVRSGAALVACSGDKLLGGPQCGILVGSAEVISKIRANPLFRALRVDKLTYAALEATLLAYLAGREDTIPVIAMLRLTAEAVRARCERMAFALSTAGVQAEVVEVRSVVGGGTTPGASLASFALSLGVAGMSEGGLAARLRASEPAVIGRVSEGRVLLDLRTVAEAEDEELIEVLRGALALQ